MNPTMLFDPLPKIETPRCVIRPATCDDLQLIETAVEDPKFPRRLPLSEMHRQGSLSKWLARMCHPGGTGTSLLWSVDLRSGDICIGQIGLSARQEVGDWALSFWIAPRLWGNSLSSEVVAALLEKAFLQDKVTQVWAATAVWNKPSIALLLRLGFLQLAGARVGYVVDDEPQEVLEFVLPKRVWVNRAKKGA